MAEIPGSVRVAGFLAPTDSTDTYAVTEDSYNKGGFRAVTALADRNAITSDRRKLGMMVYVTDEAKAYVLTAENSPNEDDNWSEFSSGGGQTEYHLIVDPSSNEEGQVYNTIQGAINAAEAAAIHNLAQLKRATIYVTPGIYTENLVIPHGITIQGPHAASQTGQEVTIVGWHSLKFSTIDFVAQGGPEILSESASHYGWAIHFSDISFSYSDAVDRVSVFQPDYQYQTDNGAGVDSAYSISFNYCSRLDTNLIAGNQGESASTPFIDFGLLTNYAGTQRTEVRISNSYITGGRHLSAPNPNDLYEEFQGATIIMGPHEGPVLLDISSSTIKFESFFPNSQIASPADVANLGNRNPAIFISALDPATLSPELKIREGSSVIGGIYAVGGGFSVDGVSIAIKNSTVDAGEWQEYADGDSLYSYLPPILFRNSLSLICEHSVIRGRMGTGYTYGGSSQWTGIEEGHFSIVGLDLDSVSPVIIDISNSSYKGGRAGVDSQLFGDPFIPGERVYGSNTQYIVSSGVVVHGTRLWVNSDPGDVIDKFGNTLYPWQQSPGLHVDGDMFLSGMMDPTALIFAEDSGTGIVTGTGFGAIFLGNGSNGTDINKLYYKDAAGNISELGSGGGMSTIYARGDNANVSPVAISDGQTLDFNGGSSFIFAEVSQDSQDPNQVDIRFKDFPTGVSAGSYKSANITVDSSGKITAAENATPFLKSDFYAFASLNMHENGGIAGVISNTHYVSNIVLPAITNTETLSDYASLHYRPTMTNYPSGMGTEENPFYSHYTVRCGGNGGNMNNMVTLKYPDPALYELGTTFTISFTHENGDTNNDDGLGEYSYHTQSNSTRGARARSDQLGGEAYDTNNPANNPDVGVVLNLIPDSASFAGSPYISGQLEHTWWSNPASGTYGYPQYTWTNAFGGQSTATPCFMLSPGGTVTLSCVEGMDQFGLLKQWWQIVAHYDRYPQYYFRLRTAAYSN